MLTNETEAEILKRVIRPEQGDLSPTVAQGFLKLGFAESDHDRMELLSAKAQKGTLTEAERSELDSYINVSHFIAFVQSKARLSLNDQSPKKRTA